MPQIDIGSDSYPSFADVDFADSFLAADVQRASAWSLIGDDPDTKGRGLVSATRMLSRYLTITPVPDPNADIATLPEPLKDATAMLAADLLAKPKLFSDASANSNIKSVRAGPAAVDFFRPVVNGPPLPQVVWDMLVAAGLVGQLPDPDDSGAPEATGVLDQCRPLRGRRAFDDWNWFLQRDYD